jgi:hypothetical protein
MTDSTDIPLELQRLRAPARGRSGRRRSELERLVDRTILGPTHPELGTCWLFTGTTTPYGRIAKAHPWCQSPIGFVMSTVPRSPLSRRRSLLPSQTQGLRVSESRRIVPVACSQTVIGVRAPM